MSYTPTEWKDGDVITAEKLNKMEDGIAAGGSGGGAFIVHSILDEQGGKHVLDKTWQEIHDNIPAFFVSESEYEGTTGTSTELIAFISETSSSEWTVGCGGLDYTTDSPNGYPENSWSP